MTEFNPYEVNVHLLDWAEPFWYDIQAGVPGLAMSSIYETIEVPDSDNGVFLPLPPPKVDEDDEFDPSSKGKTSSSTIRVTRSSTSSKSLASSLSDFY